MSNKAFTAGVMVTGVFSCNKSRNRLHRFFILMKKVRLNLYTTVISKRISAVFPTSYDSTTICIKLFRRTCNMRSMILRSKNCRKRDYAGGHKRKMTVCSSELMKIVRKKSLSSNCRILAKMVLLRSNTSRSKIADSEPTKYKKIRFRNYAKKWDPGYHQEDTYPNKLAFLFAAISKRCW